MGKMNLFILPFILSTLRLACAPPPNPKLLVELNLSRPLSRFVRAILPEDSPNAIRYAIKRAYRETHVIGAIVDVGQLIIDGDLEAISRDVLVVLRDDGSKYIQTMTRKNNQICTGEMKEFVRETGKLSYRKISRTLSSVDVLDRKGNRLIKLSDFAKSGIKRFAAHKAAQDYVTVGMVKYGNYIVDDKVDGLIYRHVTWEGERIDPQITIFSRYDDGSEIEMKYEFEDDNDIGFYCCGIRRKCPDKY